MSEPMDEQITLDRVCDAETIWLNRQMFAIESLTRNSDGAVKCMRNNWDSAATLARFAASDAFRAFPWLRGGR